MSSSIVSPFPFFTDLTGAPLEGGYLYLGQSNLNPETAPVNVFWDAALTIPAANPVRTVGGYPSRAGTASRLYVSTDTYSITVRNRNSVLVFSAFNQSDSPTSVFNIATQLITATAQQVTFTLTAFTYLPGTETLEVYRNGLRLNLGLDYLETNSSVVTLTTPAAVGDQFLFQGGAVVTGNQTPGSNVSFIQAGTGAITRNMQDKARESVSVLDFGAVGDGIADDTAAIQAAIAASKNVVFPTGNYKISSAITLANDVSVAFESGAYTSGSGSILGGSIFKQSGSGAATRSQTAAVSGSVMGIEGIIEETEYPLTVEAGIWPGGKTYAFQAISKTFDSSYATAPDLSPTAGLFVFANNKNAPGDVVGVLSDVVARTNDDKVWGANFIARNDSGTTNTKLIGLEIDVEPIVGTTVSSQSIGLALNIFSLSTSIPAIQIGGIGGGKWGNGIIVAKVTGAGIAAQSGSTMGSLADASQGTYTDCAIRLGEGVSRSIVFGNNQFGFSPYLYGDSFGNLVVNLGPNAMIIQGLLLAPNTPTTSAGLPSGGIWRDATAGNVLKMVP